MTDVEMSKLLADLSTTAATLNRESDSTNDLLAQFEEKVRAMNVGLEVSVALYLYPVEGHAELQWKKLYRGNQPMQAVEWGFGVENKHILDCSRELRIAALDRLPALIEALKEAAQAHVEIIHKAKKFLK